MFILVKVQNVQRIIDEQCCVTKCALRHRFLLNMLSLISNCVCVCATCVEAWIYFIVRTHNVINIKYESAIKSIHWVLISVNICKGSVRSD